MNSSTIGICIALGTSFFFLYTRKKKWSKPILRWSISVALFLAGILNMLLREDSSPDNRILCWELCVPFLYYSVDRLFRSISFSIQKRDFILWLSHSDEIDTSFGAKNPHVRPLDIVFSIGLLVFIILAILVGVIIFR